MEPLPQPSPLPTSRASPQQASATPRSGRKKIRIIRITDSRSRQVTFLKRKNGLLKKAHELSILCGCNVAVVIFNNDNGKLYEYFNPSAEETFQRYAVYTGVSERRRSDVMELEEAKGSCDIPNDEPEVAEAALRAANMSAIRHAHPENYEYPPPGRPQIHPNVTVPAIRMPPPPLPVHPVMGGNASRNSIAGPSRRPVPVHSPPAVDSSPKTHTLALAGRNRNAVHKNYSYAHAKTPQVARSLPFHVEEHPVAPQTARNQSPGRFGLPPLLPNEQSQQRVNSYPQVIPSTGEPVTYRNSQFSTITVRKASRTVGGIFSGQWAEGQRNSDKSLRTAPNPGDEEMIPLFIDRKMRVHGTEMGAERPTLNRPLPAAHASTRPPGVGLLNRPVCSAISADETPAQPSPLSTISPWTGEKNIAGSREMTPRTPSEQPWNNPFFRQQMQESERFNAQPMLPSLNPLLGHLPDSEFQQNGIDSTMGNMLNQARLDTLPSRSDPGLLPLSRSGTSDYNPLASVGTVRRRTSSELREHMDRQRPKR